MAVKYRQLNSKADCLSVLLERKGRKNSTQDCRNTMLVDSSMVCLLHFFGCVFAQNPLKIFVDFGYAPRFDVVLPGLLGCFVCRLSD